MIVFYEKRIEEANDRFVNRKKIVSHSYKMIESSFQSAYRMNKYSLRILYSINRYEFVSRPSAERNHIEMIGCDAVKI